jgi:hypothetical protein
MTLAEWQPMVMHRPANRLSCNKRDAPHQERRSCQFLGLDHTNKVHWSQQRTEVLLLTPMLLFCHHMMSEGCCHNITLYRCQPSTAGTCCMGFHSHDMWATLLQ